MVAGVNSPCTLPKLKVLHCTDQTLDHVASIINGQRRRSLRYQSPAALYAAVR
jgi:IS30 family transposase